MRTSLFWLALAALLAVPVALIAQDIPRMPVMSGKEEASITLAGCRQVTAKTYETEESRPTQYHGLVFWIVSDKPDKPFLAVLYRDFALAPNLNLSSWLDWNRDGIADEYYPDLASHQARFPLNNVCIEILPNVK